MVGDLDYLVAGGRDGCPSQGTEVSTPMTMTACGSFLEAESKPRTQALASWLQ